MFLFTQIAPLRAFIAAQKLSGKSIGFVPTMGALHQGHLSLIQQSKAVNDITVCSIFVNPTQFNNKEDLVKYPRTIEGDIQQLAQGGCDVLFHPDIREMYPNGESIEAYHWGNITHSLEGAARPGHFDGVIAIVKRLFEIVEPHKAFFGRKDYQQCAVVKELVRFFNLPITIVLGDTLREPDGLAMSSRNLRLSEAERREAVLISRALFLIRDEFSREAVSGLLLRAKNLLLTSPMLRLEYLEIVDAETLNIVTEFEAGKKYVVLIALWCGNVRLIDNILLGE